MRGPLAAAAAVAIALAGCSSGSGGSAPSTAPSGSTTAAAASAHWWTAHDYCGILRQTVHAGRAILPGATAGDPQVLAAARAFTTTLTAAAPPQIRPQWRTLSSAVLALVHSAGKPQAAGTDNVRRLTQAASVIAADAKTRCSLTLGS